MKSKLNPIHTVLCLTLVLAATIPAARGETKTATVAPGSHVVVNFDGDQGGQYVLQIQTTDPHRIKDSRFTAAFRTNNLWQRDSATSYHVLYRDAPKPPGVSVEGEFERPTGGGGGRGGVASGIPLPNDFLVDVPNENCIPQQTELIVELNSRGAYRRGVLQSARFNTKARWTDLAGCTVADVRIFRNLRFTTTIAYIDGSSISVTTGNTFLADGIYPGTSTPPIVIRRKNQILTSDRPTYTIPTREAAVTQDFIDDNIAEEFFMHVPTQGPPVSKMIVSWSSKVEAARINGVLKFKKGTYDPVSASIQKPGHASTRAPVATGILANTWLVSGWRLNGNPGAGSWAVYWLTSHNTH